MVIKQQKIRTRRLVLRPLQLSDYEAWRQANEDALPSQSPFDPGRRPPAKTNRAIFRKLVKEKDHLWKNDRAYFFSVFHKGKLLGSVSLVLHARVVLQTAALGCHIRNNHWRRGFASEAVENVLRFAFKKLKIHRVVAEIRVENKPSASAVKKLGFRKEGIAKRYLYENGKWNDMLIFALTAEERGVRNQKPKIRLRLEES